MAKRELTEEQRAEMRERMAKAREAAKAKREARVITQERAEAMLDAAYAHLATKEVMPHSEPDRGLVTDNEQAPVDAGAAPLASERRARLLEGVDPDIAKLISDAELDEMEAEERKRALDERKKLALTTARAALRQKAQIEHDLISPDVLLSEAEKKRRAEPVRIRINVPYEGSGKNEPSGVHVNGFRYRNGTTHTMPRCVAESIVSNMYQTWLWQYRFKALDQHKPGGSAEEIMYSNGPKFWIEPVNA